MNWIIKKWISFLLKLEPNELVILKSIDYQQIPIDVILVEALYPDIPIRAFMEQQGYKCN